jgi:hypothetical protein
MTLTRYVLLCLLVSLRKRLWMVLLSALAAGLFTVLMSQPLRLTLLASGLVALLVGVGVALSSYRRHQTDFGAFRLSHRPTDDAQRPSHR